MTLDEIVAGLEKAVAANGGMDKSVKFDFGDDGQDHVDGTDVAKDDKDADCTIKVDLEDFGKLAKGEMDPMMAFMSGKLTIDGDMGMAMKLASVLA